MDTNTGKSDTNSQKQEQPIVKEILGTHMEDMLSELKLMTGVTKLNLEITFALGREIWHLSAMDTYTDYRLMLTVCSELAEKLKKAKQKAEE